jgi:hypothetical protein
MGTPSARQQAAPVIPLSRLPSWQEFRRDRRVAGQVVRNEQHGEAHLAAEHRRGR